MKAITLILALIVLGAGTAQADGGSAVTESKPPQAAHKAHPHLDLAMSGTRSIYTQLQAEGVPFDTFAAFIGWWPGKSPKWFLDESESLGATPFISWEPDKIPLTDIANGTWDPYLVLWAETIRNRGVPVYLRMAHEMNGLWYSWSKEGPAIYKEAWRHVWNVFQAVGATNARFVWSPDGLIGKPINEWEKSVVKWYPGRRYVQYIGMSTVEFQSSVQWGLPYYFERLDFLRETYKKPMILPEMKVVESDRYHWLKNLRLFLAERPWFKLLVWSETPSTAQKAGQFETGNMNWSLINDPLARALLLLAVR
jgi:hypothetical protein